MSFAENETIAHSNKVISEKSAAPSTGATPSAGNAKIDDTLKPRQELLRSYNLEEANVWFDGFTAYFNHNEKVLQKLPASVRWQILNNSIEAALANASCRSYLATPSRWSGSLEKTTASRMIYRDRQYSGQKTTVTS